MEIPEAILGVMIGIGLAAACGFRVFVPMLVMSIAAKAGHLELSEGFQWIASWPAIIAFGLATATEIAAYHIPWLDNLLDTVATPTAIVAGIVVTAACVTDMSPFLKWTLAVIAGGGVAASVQALTVTTRCSSTATTGGATNPIVSTAEAAASGAVSAISVFVPIIVGAIILVLAALIAKRLFFRPRPSVAG